MADERKIYFKGQWWIAVFFVAFLLWLFFAGGWQWVISLF